MSFKSLLRPTCLLLMAALVHQLGASPCGCLEHNGWRNSLLALVGDAHGQESPQGLHEDAIGEAECEHTPTQAALAPTRVAVSVADDGLACGHRCAGVLASATHRLTSAARCDRLSHADLPVRAQTQVFRL